MFTDGILKGKRILVTGGGTGLGKEMAAQYLRLGADVAICGRRLSKCEETARELTDAHGGTVLPFACDIRQAQAADELIEEIWTGGPLTGLVNNAAGNFISRTQDLSPRAFDAIANIVFHGTFYVTNAVGKRWIAEEIPGSVISILATWVWTGSPYVVPSAMSKSGVAAMTRSLAAEWGRYGIRLNGIAPGPFPTEGAWARLSPDGVIDRQSKDGAIPMGRTGEMPELQNLATFLMADGCDYLTGQIIAIDGAQYLTGGGTFSDLSKLNDEQWKTIRDMIRQANDKDRQDRTV